MADIIDTVYDDAQIQERELRHTGHTHGPGVEITISESISCNLGYSVSVVTSCLNPLIVLLHGGKFRVLLSYAGGGRSLSEGLVSLCEMRTECRRLSARYASCEDGMDGFRNSRQVASAPCLVDRSHYQPLDEPMSQGLA
jgi:hypothetical protein